MAKKGLRIIDSDIHVMEPGDLWVNYIDPRYRDRAPTRERRDLAALAPVAERGAHLPRLL